MHDALLLGEHGLVRAVAAGEPRQVVEAVVVVGGRRVAPVRLEQADQVGPHVPPVALPGRVALDEGVEVHVLVRVRHRDVAGEDVEQRRDVGGPLDRRVPAQREDAAARPADVAEQRLQDRRRADVLHAHRVLRPADRVAERLVRSGPELSVSSSQTRGEQVLGDAADLLHHLRGVAGEVPLEHLEDAARVLQRLVPLALRRRSSRRRSRWTRPRPDSFDRPPPSVRSSYSWSR